MLGQRRRNVESLTSLARNTHDKDSVSPPSWNYSKQIAQALSFQKRVAVIYSIQAENSICAPFNAAYSRLDEAYQRYDTNKPEHTHEELLTLLSSILDAVRFEDVQKDLTAAAKEIAQSIIDYYDEQLDTIFSGQTFESLGAKYRLNADLRASQLEKISAIVIGHCSTIVAEARDVAQRRLWLQSNYQNIANTTNDEMNWGSIARNFGAGALAVANPWIGIPALIVNYKHQSDKNQAENRQINHYFELFDEFENKVNSLRQQIIQSAAQTKDYVKDKFSEVNGAAVVALLSETAVTGCTLDHYFKSLDLKNLENTERELFSEGV